MAYFNPNQPIVQSALSLAPTHLNTQIAKGVLDIMTSKEANDRANAELAMMQELHPERLRQIQLSNTGLELLNDYNTVRNLYADDKFRTDLDLTKANIANTQASTGLTQENTRGKRLDNDNTEKANQLYWKYVNTGDTGSASLNRAMDMLFSGNASNGFNPSINPVTQATQTMIDTLTQDPKAGVNTTVTRKNQVAVEGKTSNTPTADEVDDIMINGKPLSKMSKKEKAAARSDLTRRHADEMLVTLMDGTQMDYADVPYERRQEIRVPGEDYSDGIVSPMNGEIATEYYEDIRSRQGHELMAFDDIMFRDKHKEEVEAEKQDKVITPVEQAMGNPKVYKDYNPSIFDHQDSTEKNRYITGRSKDSMTPEEQQDAIMITPGSTIYRVGKAGIVVPDNISQVDKQALVDSVSGVFGASMDISKLEKVGQAYNGNNVGKLKGKGYITPSDLGAGVSIIYSANDMLGTGVNFTAKAATNATAFKNSTVEHIKQQGNTVFNGIDLLDKPSENEGIKKMKSNLEAIRGEKDFKTLETFEGKKGKDLFNKEAAIYLAETLPTYIGGDIRFDDSSLTRQKFLDAVSTPPEKDESIESYFNRLGKEGKLNFFGSKHNSLGKNFAEFVYATYHLAEEKEINFMSKEETKKKFRDKDTGKVTEIPYFNDVILKSVDSFLNKRKQSEVQKTADKYNEEYGTRGSKKASLYTNQIDDFGLFD